MSDNYVKKLENYNGHTRLEVVYPQEAVPYIVQEFLVDAWAHKRIMTLEGPLGAGKTTLARALLQSYGISQPVTSPTFTYVNTYYDASGQVLYHFDLYRIQSLDAFCAAGFEEYLFDERARCLIEWPAVIAPLLAYESLAAAVVAVTLQYVPCDLERRCLIMMQ